MSLQDLPDNARYLSESNKNKQLEKLKELEGGQRADFNYRAPSEIVSAWSVLARNDEFNDIIEEQIYNGNIIEFSKIVQFIIARIRYNLYKYLIIKINNAKKVYINNNTCKSTYILKTGIFAGLDIPTKKLFHALLAQNLTNQYQSISNNVEIILDDKYSAYKETLKRLNHFWISVSKLIIEILLSPDGMDINFVSLDLTTYDRQKHEGVAGNGSNVIPIFPVIVRAGSRLQLTNRTFVARCSQKLNLTHNEIWNSHAYVSLPNASDLVEDYMQLEQYRPRTINTIPSITNHVRDVSEFQLSRNILGPQMSLTRLTTMIELIKEGIAVYNIEILHGITIALLGNIQDQVRFPVELWRHFVQAQIDCGRFVFIDPPFQPLQYFKLVKDGQLLNSRLSRAEQLDACELITFTPLVDILCQRVFDESQSKRYNKPLCINISDFGSILLEADLFRGITCYAHPFIYKY